MSLDSNATANLLKKIIPDLRSFAAIRPEPKAPVNDRGRTDAVAAHRASMRPEPKAPVNATTAVEIA